MIRNRKPKARQVSKPFTVQAPTGGLNAYDSIAAMAENDAVLMTNWYPEPYGLSVRKGSKEHTTGMNGPVGTIMTFFSTGGAMKVLAADSSFIHDVTTPGVVSVGTRLCASSSPWWQDITFSNPSGNHLIAFNGVDDGVCYESDGMHRLTAGNGTDPYTWSGVDPKNIIGVMVHQKRLWAVQKNSMQCWYLPPEQIYGAAVGFNFGACFSEGGHILQLIPWTVDSGYGSSDYMCVITSGGEVAIWEGIDPSSSTGWALVGVYFAGVAFSNRCAVKFGGDVLFLTQFGLVTLTSMMATKTDSMLTNAMSRKIQHLISGLIAAGSDIKGWQVLPFPTANMVLVNVPGIEASQNLQLAYNTLTKAWTMFSGWQANCWITSYSWMLYGGEGKIYKAWDGYLDGVLLDGSGGSPIVAECQSAFSYFQSPGMNKHCKMIRPTMVYSGVFRYRIGANVDFDFDTIPNPASFNFGDSGIWGSSLWDSTATWSGGNQSSKQWVSVEGIGFCAAARMKVESSSELIWVSTDWLLEAGGVI